MGRTEVILHGGFHKTATTHVQGILKRNENYLARQGVRYAHHRLTRKEFTVPVQLNGYLHLGIPRRRKIDDAGLRAMTTAFFKKLSKGGPDRVILSDENFAGHCGQCVRGGALYTFRHEFMGTFAREIPFVVSEIHLAIRHHADFFAAAYVEFLRSLKANAQASRFVSETDMKRDVLENRPSWADVLADVRDALPSAKIVVWRYEDYRALSDQILTNLCGPKVDISRLKTPKSNNQRPTASGEAVARMLAAHDAGGLAQLVDQRVALQEAHPRGRDWGRYDPWDAAERADLGETYDQDWARICASGEYEILQPATGGTVDGH